MFDISNANTAMHSILFHAQKKIILFRPQKNFVTSNYFYTISQLSGQPSSKTLRTLLRMFQLL